MTVKELEELQLDDKAGEWRLLTNSQNITDIMLGWKLEDNDIELIDIGCLFVRWLADDIDQAWYCESNIPYHHKQVYQLK